MRASIISNSIYQISGKKYDNLGKLIFLNSVFLVNQSFGVAAQSITPEITTEMDFKNLGQILIVFTYMFSMINTIASPLYLKKLQYSVAFFIHAFFGVFICINGAFVTICHHYECSKATVYSVTIFINCVAGFFQGGLWVAQNVYISECTNHLNKGLFFGISNSLSNSGQMIGSLLSAFLIQPLGDLKYFVLLTILSFVTQLLFFFTLQPPGHEKKTKEILQIVEEQESEQSSLKDVEFESVNPQLYRDTFTLKQIAGQPNKVKKAQSHDDNLQSIMNQNPIITQRVKSVYDNANLLQRTKSQFEVVEFFHELPFTEQMKQILSVAMGEKIRPLLPYLFQTGLVIGFEYGVFYKLITLCVLHELPNASSLEVNSKTFFVFGLQGLAEIFGGVIMGAIGQKITNNLAAVVQNNLMIFVLILTFTNSFYLSYNVCLVLGFLWYYQTLIFITGVSLIVPVKRMRQLQYRRTGDWGDDVRVFGVYNFLQNLAGMTSLIVSIILVNSQFYYFVLLFLLFEIFVNYNLASYRRNRKVETI